MSGVVGLGSDAMAKLETLNFKVWSYAFYMPSQGLGFPLTLFSISRDYIRPSARVLYVFNEVR